MNHGSSTEFQDATTASVDELMSRSDMSARDKLEILENWHLQLRDLQVATEENMGASETRRGLVGEKLRAVNEAIRRIQHDSH